LKKKPADCWSHSNILVGALGLEKSPEYDPVKNLSRPVTSSHILSFGINEGIAEKSKLKF